jgi:hypothetical protein
MAAGKPVNFIMVLEMRSRRLLQRLGALRR